LHKISGLVQGHVWTDTLFGSGRWETRWRLRWERSRGADCRGWWRMVIPPSRARTGQRRWTNTDAAHGRTCGQRWTWR